MEVNNQSFRLIGLLEKSGPLLLIISGIVLLSYGTLRAQTAFQSNIIVVSSIFLVLLGGGISALTYLRGQGQISGGGRGRDNFVNITNTLEESDIERIVRSVIEHSQASSSQRVIELSDEERREIVVHMKSLTSEEVSAQLVSAASNRVSSFESSHFQELKAELKTTKLRLESEILALSRRGNLNLVIGSITTIIAVGLLGYVVLSAQTTATDLKEFVWHYLPRITISIFIQVFSFFFLKLYRNSLDDIKYFQNELTNIDAKYASLESSLMLRDREIISKVIEEISTTDRNFRLNAGESTVSLEKLKEENKGLKEMLSSAKELIQSVKKA